MIPLPFTMQLPGQDHTGLWLILRPPAWQGRAIVTAWSSFTVHGFLQCDGVELFLEWSVIASTSEVDGFGVRSATESLPVEAVAIPLERLYEARARTRWWRPHVELVAGDLNVFVGVPGAVGGKLRLDIARSDRALALEVVDQVNDGIRRAQQAPRLEDSDELPVTTPPPGV